MHLVLGSIAPRDHRHAGSSGCDSGAPRPWSILEFAPGLKFQVRTPTGSIDRVRSRNSLPHFAHSAGQRECRNCARHEAHDCITSRSVRRAALRLCVHMYLDWLLLTQPQTTVVVQSGKMHATRSASVSCRAVP